MDHSLLGGQLRSWVVSSSPSYVLSWLHIYTSTLLGTQLATQLVQLPVPSVATQPVLSFIPDPIPIIPEEEKVCRIHPSIFTVTSLLRDSHFVNITTFYK